MNEQECPTCGGRPSLLLHDIDMTIVCTKDKGHIYECDELRQKIAALGQRRRDESDPTSDCPNVLMAKTIVQSLLDERDMLKNELDRELRIGTDYMKKLAACEKERDEWMHEFKAEYKRGAEQPNTYQQLNKKLKEERKHIRYLLTLAYGKLYAYKINLRDPALTSQIEKYLQTTSD
jgi:hypothetical protein